MNVSSSARMLLFQAAGITSPTVASVFPKIIFGMMNFLDVG
jgi:hypothetical protein